MTSLEHRTILKVSLRKFQERGHETYISSARKRHHDEWRTRFRRAARFVSSYLIMEGSRRVIANHVSQMRIRAEKRNGRGNTYTHKIIIIGIVAKN